MKHLFYILSIALFFSLNACTSAPPSSQEEEQSTQDSTTLQTQKQRPTREKTFVLDKQKQMRLIESANYPDFIGENSPLQETLKAYFLTQQDYLEDIVGAGKVDYGHPAHEEEDQHLIFIQFDHSRGSKFDGLNFDSKVAFFTVETENNEMTFIKDFDLGDKYHFSKFLSYENIAEDGIGRFLFTVHQETGKKQVKEMHYTKENGFQLIHEIEIFAYNLHDFPAELIRLVENEGYTEGAEYVLLEDCHQNPQRLRFDGKKLVLSYPMDAMNHQIVSMETDIESLSVLQYPREAEEPRNNRVLYYEFKIISDIKQTDADTLTLVAEFETSGESVVISCQEADWFDGRYTLKEFENKYEFVSDCGDE